MPGDGRSQSDPGDKTSQDEVSPVFDTGDLAIGTDVGGYLIDGEIGRGGMGVVYEATHPVIGKRAAIKVLRPSLSANPATVERFTQEARSVNQIGHPGIVDIFAFGALPDGRRYLVMDLLVGEPLRKRLKRGPLPVGEGLHVIDEIAAALIAAHAKGFIHRDLKPDNVFLVAHPGRLDVRLLDFGLAKLMPGAGSQRAYRTATGAQLGTPDYMSPEQLRASNALDERTDIFSLGVMAFETITGIRPRRTGTDSYNLSAPPSELVAAMPGAPRELAQLIEQMMAVNPLERPSLAQVRQTFKRIRPSLPSLSAVDLPVASPQPDESMELTASKVGAKPVLPTPVGGNPLHAPALPPHDEDRLMTTRRGHVPAGPLRTSGTHPSTTLGVPPPPAASPSRPYAVPKRVPTAIPGKENRIWLVIGALLVVAAAVALVLVLAT